MFRATAAAAGALALAASVAQAGDYELIAIGNGSSDGGRFGMLSFRAQLSSGDEAGEAGAAKSGLRVRVDTGRSQYETSYDGTDGHGRNDFARVLLTYGQPLSDNALITFIGGATYRNTYVRPQTASAPADVTQYGGFVGAEFEYTVPDVAYIQALAEYDSTAGSYASLTALSDFGDLRVGPTFNYIVDGNYSRTAFGVVAEYTFTETFDMRLTGATATSQVAANPSSTFSYLEFQLRREF